jgi:hypothetical protein
MSRTFAPGTNITLPPGLSLYFSRVDAPGDEPPPVAGVVDVAVLDMHHGYPNLGHASIVESVLNWGHEERVRREGAAPGFRVISYDVRSRGAVPTSRASRFPIVIGSGGPGALDPRDNDGIAAASQGVNENPSWEAPLWRFFDEILGSPGTSFLAICHSFGVLARWAGVAEAALRPESKGGKSAGIVSNVLSESAHRHPWFRGYWVENGGPRVHVLDSRLFDLVPTGRGHAEFLAFESKNGGGTPGEAMTMLELVRGADGILPRIWGVNHHPEIGDRGLQRERLQRLWEREEVTEAWYLERRRALDAWNAEAATEHGLQKTSEYTFEKPVRALIARAFDERG